MNNKRGISKDLEEPLQTIFDKKEDKRIQRLIKHRQKWVEKSIRRRNKAARKKNRKTAEFWNRLARKASNQLAKYYQVRDLHRYKVRLRLEEYDEYTICKRFRVVVSNNNIRDPDLVITRI